VVKLEQNMEYLSSKVFADVNWVAFAVSVAVAQFIGGMWFGPVFGERRVKALGVEKTPLDKMTQLLGVSVITNALTCLILIRLIHLMKITSLSVKRV
jgi:hypothetical protein